MRLTAEEIRKIDEALQALKKSLKDELESLPEEKRSTLNMDGSFLKTIGEAYLSGEDGIINLLVDSGQLGLQARCSGFAGCFPQRNCVCGATCAQPQQG